MPQIKEQRYQQITAHVSVCPLCAKGVKTLFMKMLARSEAQYNTTGFSNIGLIKLSSEIESRVEHIEFIISLEHDAPYFFSCVTIGNALAITGTFRDEGRDVVEAVMRSIGHSPN